MRLLFDQNLSPQLTQILEDLFPDSAHVHNLGLGQTRDSEIWRYAKTQDYVIVTKDSDFHEKRILSGEPPNVIWIRKGNCSTKMIEFLLRKGYPAIIRLEQEKQGFLVLR